ncbi:MAG: hypothetical protein R3B09_22465 [Nannocystaceae bacterium]
MTWTRAAHRRIFFALVVALIALHVDVWNLDRAGPLLLGVLPIDFAYHLGWTAAAWLTIVYLTAKVWPEGP